MTTACRRLGTWSRDGRRRNARGCATTCQRSGFRATIRGRSALALARETLALAHQGLVRRKRLDRNGRDETRYLRPLDEIVAHGITPAEELLEKFHGVWKGSIDPIYTDYAY